MAIGMLWFFLKSHQNTIVHSVKYTVHSFLSLSAPHCLTHPLSLSCSSVHPPFTHPLSSLPSLSLSPPFTPSATASCLTPWCLHSVSKVASILNAIIYIRRFLWPFGRNPCITIVIPSHGNSLYTYSPSQGVNADIHCLLTAIWKEPGPC